jgi:hypothetical protein
LRLLPRHFAHPATMITVFAYPATKITTVMSGMRHRLLSGGARAGAVTAAGWLTVGAE